MCTLSETQQLDSLWWLWWFIYIHLLVCLTTAKQGKSQWSTKHNKTVRWLTYRPHNGGSNLLRNIVGQYQTTRRNITEVSHSNLFTAPECCVYNDVGCLHPDCECYVDRHLGMEVSAVPVSTKYKFSYGLRGSGFGSKTGRLHLARLVRSVSHARCLLRDMTWAPSSVYVSTRVKKGTDKSEFINSW